MSESAESGSLLSHDLVKKGLGVLGKHPIMLNHTFLELKLPEGDVSNIDILANFPHLMYVKMAKNKITDLKVLENLPSLVQLDASNNELTKCLDFTLAQCTNEKAWADGDTALGSMLTLANLSSNKIRALPDLSHHLHLEVLLLANNGISKIEGLSSLKFLNVLDLSHNRISKIESLDGLLMQELNLEGNRITSLDGLSQLPRLSSLNVNKNDIMSLNPLKDCTQLRVLSACDNRLVHIRQTEFLSELPWLGVLELNGNPCSNKQLYRRRVLFRLPKLERLDKSNVTAEEKIETANLYSMEEGGDLAERASVFKKHYPQDNFEQHGPFFMDDENAVTDEQLLEVYTGGADHDSSVHSALARDASTKLIGDLTAAASSGQLLNLSNNLNDTSLVVGDSTFDGEDEAKAGELVLEGSQVVEEGEETFSPERDLLKLGREEE